MNARARMLHVMLIVAMLSSMGMSNAAMAEVYVVVSADSPLNTLELREVRSIYKGRLTQVKGQRVVPLNAAPGSYDRIEFLNSVMNVSELDYTGYWHVRRYSGQGTPPNEVKDQVEMFNQIKADPQRIGYLKVPPGQKPEVPAGLKLIPLK
jgi:ABC-type phosphate transport system substrate-binding protein